MPIITTFLIAAAGCVPLAALPAPAAEGEAPPLKNPGFEKGLDGWSLHVYGARPAVEPDGEVVHEGKRSLRIRAEALSDTALGQEVTLRPGRCYRLSGWVRTRQLDPHGAPVFGTFQVQLPGGRGVLASGTNHRGDADWTRVDVPFEAPPDGRARIAVFFVGFGKGTGTAWFDGLELKSLDAAASPPPRDAYAPVPRRDQPAAVRAVHRVPV